MDFDGFWSFPADFAKKNPWNAGSRVLTCVIRSPLMSRRAWLGAPDCPKISEGRSRGINDIGYMDDTNGYLVGGFIHFFYFPKNYWGWWSNLTNSYFSGWWLNHQPVFKCKPVGFLLWVFDRCQRSFERDKVRSSKQISQRRTWWQNVLFQSCFFEVPSFEPYIHIFQ